VRIHLVAIVVDEYDPAIEFFVDALGFRPGGGLSIADEALRVRLVRTARHPLRPADP